jgi:2-polyprenyl-6-methoxyphenol hydroxylase-like FAD-dependent oxidoreductase
MYPSVVAGSRSQRFYFWCSVRLYTPWCSAQQWQGAGSTKLGEADECDLLTAADGANSKIRACLRPDDTLSFTGAVCVGGRAKFSDGIPAPVDKEWGAVIGASGTGLFASPLDEQSAVWSLSYLASEPREKVQGVGDQLLQEALDRGRVIAQPFKTFVQATDVSNVGIYNAKDKVPFPTSRRRELGSRAMLSS